MMHSNGYAWHRGVSDESVDNFNENGYGLAEALERITLDVSGKFTRRRIGPTFVWIKIYLHFL